METNKPETKVLTRIYVNDEGNIVVTDLWSEIRELLIAQGGFGEADSDL